MVWDPRGGSTEWTEVHWKNSPTWLARTSDAELFLFATPQIARGEGCIFHPVVFSPHCRFDPVFTPPVISKFIFTVTRPLS